MSLLGKKALVTGGLRGLGLAIAERLARHGAGVTLVARDAAALAQRAAALPVVGELQVHGFCAADLLQIRSHADLSCLARQLQGISVLVNCAGMTNHSLLARTSAEQISDTIHLNLTVPIMMSRCAVREMMRFQSDTKCIINISSVLSVTGEYAPGTSVYAASKAGLVGFTTSLAHELRGKVRVNAILPGLIRETDMGKLALLGHSTSCTLEQVTNEVMALVTPHCTSNGLCLRV